jgi:hypothetical protein
VSSIVQPSPKPPVIRSIGQSKKKEMRRGDNIIILAILIEFVNSVLCHNNMLLYFYDIYVTKVHDMLP